MFRYPSNPEIERLAQPREQHLTIRMRKAYDESRPMVDSEDPQAGSKGSPFGILVVNRMLELRLGMSAVTEFIGYYDEHWYTFLPGRDATAHSKDIEPIFRLALLLQLPPEDLWTVYLLSRKRLISPIIRGTFSEQTYGLAEIQALYPRFLPLWAKLKQTPRFGAYGEPSPYGLPAIHFSRLWRVFTLPSVEHYSKVFDMIQALTISRERQTYASEQRLPVPEQALLLTDEEQAGLLASFATLFEVSLHLDYPQERLTQLLEAFLHAWDILSLLDDTGRGEIIRLLEVSYPESLPPPVDPHLRASSLVTKGIPGAGSIGKNRGKPNNRGKKKQKTQEQAG